MGRAGEYVKAGSYRAFRPSRLPPHPPVAITEDISFNLSRADRALARLDGAIATIPDPEMLVYAFMRQEAILSSQIEGTQASLEDLFEYEIENDEANEKTDVVEVVSYLRAMKWTLSELARRPVSLNLVREAHAILLSKGRGAQRAPGEFRRAQNWIGPAGCTLEEASFVPPAVPDMLAALGDLEDFIHRRDKIPDLIRCAIIHAQFETIHPFWDGNGRIGRMLITLLLCEREILESPALYLSLFFKKHRDEYYQKLQAVRTDGNWEDWILFFLRGVAITSKSALIAARRIRDLREKMLNEAGKISNSQNAFAFGELLFHHPYLRVQTVADRMKITFPTANALVKAYEKTGYLQNVTGQRRHRIFAFRAYLDILHECADDLTDVIGETDHLVTPSNPS